MSEILRAKERAELARWVLARAEVEERELRDYIEYWLNNKRDVCEYLKCYTLTRRWKTHTSNRCFLASLLAEIYAYIGIRRRASMLITPSLYRELEEYAEETNLLVRAERPRRRKWEYFLPYGKPAEISVYLSYTEKKGRERRFEIRLWIGIPLHWSDRDLLEYEESLKDVALELLEAYGIWDATIYWEAENIKVGLRRNVEMPENIAEGKWCNKVPRVPLFKAYVEVYDMNYDRVSGEFESEIEFKPGAGFSVP